MKSSSSLRRCAGAGCANSAHAQANGVSGGGASNHASGAEPDGACATQATINRGRKAVIRMLGE